MRSAREPPRLAASLYYALGSAGDAGRTNMARYQAFGGDAMERAMTGGLLTEPDAIRERIAGLEAVGVQEVYLWPAASAPDQIDALAGAVGL